MISGLPCCGLLGFLGIFFRIRRVGNVDPFFFFAGLNQG